MFENFCFLCYMLKESKECTRILCISNCQYRTKICAPKFQSKLQHICLKDTVCIQILIINKNYKQETLKFPQKFIYTIWSGSYFYFYEKKHILKLKEKS